MKHIIGLLGKAGSGKSTIADHLFKQYGFRVFSFSKPIKEMAMDYFNVSYEEAFSTKPPHVRTILQGIGKLVRDIIGDDFLIDEMEKCIHYSEAECIVIDDVRLKEEAEFIKDIGGIIVKVECSNVTQSLSVSQQADITEQIDAIPYDHLLSASYGDLEKLRDGIDGILEKNPVEINLQGNIVDPDAFVSELKKDSGGN